MVEFITLHIHCISGEKWAIFVKEHSGSQWVPMFLLQVKATGA
jgi:hypothetical protein